MLIGVSHVVGKGVSFFVLAYLARTLLAGRFGKLSFAQAVGIYFQMLINLGLDTFGAREVARSPGKTRRYVDDILGVRLLAAMVAFGLLAAVAYVLPKDAETKELVLYTGLSVVLFAFTLEWLFQGIEKMQIIAASRTLQQVLQAVLIVAFVSIPHHVVRVPIARFVSGVVATLLLLGAMAKQYGWPRPRFDPAAWKGMLRESLPIAFSSLMIAVYYNADTVMLGFLKSDEMVGWYNAAYRLVFILLLPVDTIRTALFPALSRIDDTVRLEKITNAYVKTMFILGIPVGFAGTILAPYLINVVYGADYVNAILPLQILTWNVMLVFINESYGAPLLAWGKQVRYTQIVTVSAVTNTVGNLLLIPPFGMVGAAVATVLAEVAAFVGVYPHFQKTIRIPFLRYAVRPIIASIVMSVVLLAVVATVHNVFGLLVIGAGAYLLSLVGIGGLGRKDLELLLVRDAGTGGTRH